MQLGPAVMNTSEVSDKAYCTREATGLHELSIARDSRSLSPKMDCRRHSDSQQEASTADHIQIGRVTGYRQRL